MDVKEIVQHYNETGSIRSTASRFKAWDIINDFSLPTSEQQEQINNLLAGFLEMCKL